MATWFTYAVPSWETELEELENEMDNEYQSEENYEKDLDMYEYWLFDQKMDFYEDLGNVGGTFTKFLYKTPGTYTEDTWCVPKFNCYDPMGLFFKFIDKPTFNIVMLNILKIHSTCYRPLGTQYYDYNTLKTLFLFAERWCIIHILYDEESPTYNYKLTLWVVSRIMLYLND